MGDEVLQDLLAVSLLSVFNVSQRMQPVQWVLGAFHRRLGLLYLGLVDQLGRILQADDGPAELTNLRWARAVLQTAQNIATLSG